MSQLLLSTLIKAGQLIVTKDAKAGDYLTYPDGREFDGKWEIQPEDKAVFLKQHYIFAEVPDLEDVKLCIHCDKTFKVRDYKSVIDLFDEEPVPLIVCPNAPDCDGTMIDWMRVE